MQKKDRESEQALRYRLLVENLKDYAVFTTDTAGKIDSWNAGAQETLGYSRGEAVGQALDLIFTPEDRLKNAPQLELETAAREGRAEDNRWHVRKDGSRLWVNGILLALFDEEHLDKEHPGQLRGFAKIIRDETARLQQEQELSASHETLENRVRERTEALRRSEDRFHKAFSSSPAPTVIVCLSDKCYLNVNESFLLLTDYTRDEVVGQTLNQVDLYVDQPDRERILGQLRRGVPVPLREMEIRKKSGETLSVMVASEIIDVDDEACQLDIFIDITERKRSEAQLMRAIEEVMSDTTWFSRSVVEKLTQLRSGDPDQTGIDELTARERQVLSYVAKGSSNDVISGELGLATQTVRNYISSIYEKLGLHTRAEVIVWARERGLG